MLKVRTHYKLNSLLGKCIQVPHYKYSIYEISDADSKRLCLQHENVIYSLYK